MKAYIQSHNQKIEVPTFSNAASGLKSLGYDIELFEEGTLPPTDNPADIVVGSVDITRDHLAKFKLSLPPLDYPPELAYLRNRNIENATLQDVINQRIPWPVFVKPHSEKLFCGTVINTSEDILDLGDLPGDTPIFVSPVIEFVSEWRFYILHGEIIGLFPYKGKPSHKCDLNIVQEAISKYTNAPAGYAMDFGVSPNGTISLIEVNDGYSLCSYILPPKSYAQLLVARWMELTQNIKIS